MQHQGVPKSPSVAIGGSVLYPRTEGPVNRGQDAKFEGFETTIFRSALLLAGTLVMLGVQVLGQKFLSLKLRVSVEDGFISRTPINKLVPQRASTDRCGTCMRGGGDVLVC